MDSDTEGTESNPIETDGPDRRAKFCKCYRCGIVARCTPIFDFYTKVQTGDPRLYCENCMRSDHSKAGRAMIDLVQGLFKNYGS